MEHVTQEIETAMNTAPTIAKKTKNINGNINRYTATTRKMAKEQEGIKRVGQIGRRQRRLFGMAKKRLAQLGWRTNHYKGTTPMALRRLQD